MTKEFYAKHLEKKLRKRLLAFCLTFIVIAAIIGLVLLFFVNEFVSLVFVIIFVLSWRLWAHKKIAYNLYCKPIYEIFEQKVDLELFKCVYEQSLIYNPFDYKMILLAFFEGDYQKAINICAYNIKNCKNKNLVCVSMVFLMHGYYDLQDIENLKKAKYDYEKFLKQNPQMPKGFLEFVDNYLNGNFDFCKRYLLDLSEKETLTIGKVRAHFRLAYINYITGNLDEAKRSFAYVCEKAPNLYHAQISRQYIEAIDNKETENFSHTKDIPEILPQEDFITQSPKKRKSKPILPIVFTLAIIIAIGVYIYDAFFRTYFEYTIEPETVEVLYGYTVDELLSTNVDLYDDIGDFRKNSIIDDNGNLVIKYTKLQAHTLKNSEWITDFEQLEKITHTDVSDDYKSILIYITPEMKRYTEEEWISYENKVSSVFLKITMYQMVNRVPNDKRTISYKVIDQDAGIVLYDDTWNPNQHIPYFSTLYYDYYLDYTYNVNCILRSKYNTSTGTIGHMNIYFNGDYIETVFIIDNNGKYDLVGVIHDDHGMPHDIVVIQENVQKNQEYDVISPISNNSFGFHIFKNEKYEDHKYLSFVTFKIRNTNYRFCVDYINNPTE